MTDTQSIDSLLVQAEQLGIDTSVARAAIGDIEDAFAEAMEPDVVLGRAYRVAHADELRKTNGTVDAGLIGRTIRGAVAAIDGRIVTGDEQPVGELGGYVHVREFGIVAGKASGVWAPKTDAVWSSEAKAREWCPDGFRVAAVLLLPEGGAR